MASRPVHWHEGMFLRPQHFQAADRHARETSEGLGGLVPPLQLGAPLGRVRPRRDRQLLGDAPLVRGPVQGRDEADDPGRRDGRPGRAQGALAGVRRRHGLPGRPALQSGRANVEETPTANGPRYWIDDAGVQRREHRQRRSADPGPPGPRPPAPLEPGPYRLRGPAPGPDRALGAVRGAAAARPRTMSPAPGPRRLAPALASRPVALPPDRRHGRADWRPRSSIGASRSTARSPATPSVCSSWPSSTAPLVAGGDRVRPGPDPAGRLPRALPPGRPARDLLGDPTAPQPAASTTTRTSAAASTRSSSTIQLGLDTIAPVGVREALLRAERRTAPGQPRAGLAGQHHGRSSSASRPSSATRSASSSSARWT